MRDLGSSNADVRTFVAKYFGFFEIYRLFELEEVEPVKLFSYAEVGG